MPRAVKHPPFVQYFAPIVWTTLELTIHADGTHHGAMTGASGFPRHWVFDDGSLVAKSSVAEYKSWMNESFGKRTPWGDEDSPALVTEVETLLERELHEAIMRGGAKPDIRKVTRGALLVDQGAPTTSCSSCSTACSSSRWTARRSPRSDPEPCWVNERCSKAGRALRRCVR